ncbi:MAG: preprotein translocase subunit YajC [Pirellulaceae bacterium]|nr:preprotein translocase subunit YajC [Pirellulaceae bacterium]
MDNCIPVIDMFTTAIVRLALLAQAPAPGAGAAGEGAPEAGEINFFTSFFGNPVNLLMLAVMLFFFIVIWPQQRQAKSQQLAHEKALAGMKKNDRVITSGGIHGVIIQANSDEPVITIRIDENTGARMTVNRDAVVKVFTET